MPNDFWKYKRLIVGGVLGLALGIFAASLYVRTEEEELERRRNEPVKPKMPSAGAVMRIAMWMVTVVRQIADLPRQSR